MKFPLQKVEVLVFSMIAMSGCLAADRPDVCAEMDVGIFIRGSGELLPIRPESDSALERSAEYWPPDGEPELSLDGDELLVPIVVDGVCGTHHFTLSWLSHTYVKGEDVRLSVKWWPESECATLCDQQEERVLRFNIAGIRRMAWSGWSGQSPPPPTTLRVPGFAPIVYEFSP